MDSREALKVARESAAELVAGAEGNASALRLAEAFQVLDNADVFQHLDEEGGYSDR